MKATKQTLKMLFLTTCIGLASCSGSGTATSNGSTTEASDSSTLSINNNSPYTASSIEIYQSGKLLNKIQTNILSGQSSFIKISNTSSESMSLKIYDNDHTLIFAGDTNNGILGDTSKRIYISNVTYGAYLTSLILQKHPELRNKSQFQKLLIVFKNYNPNSYLEYMSLIGQYAHKKGANLSTDDLVSLFYNYLQNPTPIPSGVLTKDPMLTNSQSIEPQNKPLLSSFQSKSSMLSSESSTSDVLSKIFINNTEAINTSNKIISCVVNNSDPKSCITSAQVGTNSFINRMWSFDTLSGVAPEAGTFIAENLKSAGVKCPISHKGLGIFNFVTSIVSEIAPEISPVVGLGGSIVKGLCPGGDGLIGYLDQQFKQLNTKLDEMQTTLNYVSNLETKMADVLVNFQQQVNKDQFLNNYNIIYNSLQSAQSSYNKYLDAFSPNTLLWVQANHLCNESALIANNEDPEICNPNSESAPTNFNGIAHFIDAVGFIPTTSAPGKYYSSLSMPHSIDAVELARILHKL